MRAQRASKPDADFLGYVGARWPGLVRTVVLLGGSEEVADGVARDALARLQPEWSRVRQAADVDAEVHAVLLDAWDRFRSRDADVGRPAPLADPMPLDPELVAELDALTPTDRAARVLAGGERMRRATETVPVLAPPTTAELAALRRGASRRRSRRALAVAVPVVAALALAAGGVAWLAQRGGDGDLGPVTVARQENPAPLDWEAGGVLHLAHVTMTLPAFRQVAPLDPGAVYLDRVGRVVYVGDDGVRRLLGTAAPGTRFVSSDEQGWVAWVDRRETPATLVVYEVASRSVVGRHTLASRGRAVAIDDDTVYYVDADGAHSWRPTSGTPSTPVQPAALLDVQSRTRVFQIAPDTIRIEPAMFDFGLAVPGSGARLSPDGRYVVTRLGGPGVSYGEVAVYDTRSGTRLDSGIASNEVALDAVAGADATVSYLVVRASDRPQSDTYIRSSFAGRVQLRTCTLQPAGDPAQCAQDTSDIPASGVAPLLAH